jgi:hypothetical protein
LLAIQLENPMQDDFEDSIPVAGNTPASPKNRTKPGGVLIAYMMEYVPERPGHRAFWAKTKVGAAFSNDDGSYWVELAAIPRSGKLLLRKPIQKDQQPLEQPEQLGAV